MREYRNEVIDCGVVDAAKITYIAEYAERIHPEDGGSKFFQNVGILSHYYTAPQPRSRLE
jgi:hypothetical protein